VTHNSSDEVPTSDSGDKTNVDEKALREEIISVGKRLHDLRLVAATGGNLSARLRDKTILITATAVSLGLLGNEDLIEVDVAQQKDGNNKRLSTEFPLHRQIYETFLEVSSVIHCHPALTNAYFSVYDDVEVLTVETRIFLGRVPVIEQSTPTVTKPQEVIDAFEASNIVVIKNHGVVAIGESFTKALYLIEALEEAVRVAGVARIFQKEDRNVFEEELQHALTKPLSPVVHKMFSPGHIQALVELVNNDALIAQKGTELDLTVELALKLQEDQDTAYRLCFEKGRIIRIQPDDRAPFVIAAPERVWRQVFLGRLDPFVATTQGKMKLQGELGKLSRWYVPFSRLFELFKFVEIQ